MEVKATAKYLRVQPRKVRIVADEIKGMPGVYAAHKLRYHTSKGARLLRKVLVNAMANAAENNGLSPEGLKIARIEVNEGPRQKRIQARSMGRANRILKKTSHITVVVEEFEAPAAVKPHGAKAKPRPTFGPVKAKKKAPAKAEVVEETAPAVEEVSEVVEQADAPVEETNEN
ncbi:MAG TPA: 50S ribosomal protein L22 [Fimbriimonas sp.]|jgi:large subunit ribosomal protein L22|nr:50S ribosomal protein L22 [Fimbriimonas sp.]